MPCVYVKHVFPELNDFMAVLDGRLSKKQPQATGLVAKKVRKTGIPSDSVQPQDAPVWAVIKDTGTP